MTGAREGPKLNAILLAAGRGERLRPITDNIPKCLVPIGGRPLLAHWLDALDGVGVEDATINTHWLPEAVTGFLKARGGRPNVRVFHETELLGSAGTIAENIEWLTRADSTLIVYADNYCRMDLSAMVRFHNAHALGTTLGTFDAPDPMQCGIAETNADGVVTHFEEKPAVPRSNQSAAGVYVMRAEALRELASLPRPAGAVFDLGRHVFPALAGRMKAYPIKGTFIDIGTPDAYRRAQEAAAR